MTAGTGKKSKLLISMNQSWRMVNQVNLTVTKLWFILICVSLIFVNVSLGRTSTVDIVHKNLFQIGSYFRLPFVPVLLITTF